MKLAIVTHPLIYNFGGLLQNWALQTVLKQEFPGCEVITFDQVDSVAPLYLRIGHRLKTFLRGNSKKGGNEVKPFDFRRDFINTTPKAKSIKDFKKFSKKFSPDLLIVGSDQVWRPSMVNNLRANFLGFYNKAKKISYAASFGVDTWEFDESETKLCKSLIGEFDGISVREESGIGLVNQYFQKEAVLVLDPTMLLDKNSYEKLASNYEAKLPNGSYFFSYILDTNTFKQSVVRSFTEGLEEYPTAFDQDGVMHMGLNVFDWLIGMMKSEFVICDSFHAVAFSIIFNKNFFVLGNKRRGNTRIESILRLFHLESRLVDNFDSINKDERIDWVSVNRKREELKKISINFLHKHI